MDGSTRKITEETTPTDPQRTHTHTYIHTEREEERKGKGREPNNNCKYSRIIPRYPGINSLIAQRFDFSRFRLGLGNRHWIG